MWRDYDVLMALAEAEGWDDGTPVDVARLGPLWPDGPPEGWPVEEEQFDREEEPTLDVAFALPPLPDTPEARAALKSRIRAVLESLNATHLAAGGSGLEIDGATVYARKHAPAGVKI